MIERYISELLYRYQCVTVPGFGAFLSEWQSAQVSEVDNSFNPPRKNILFNPHIKTNDGLLANYIALATKCTYEVAVHQIQQQVTFWNDRLVNKEIVTLNHIGDLFYNNENNIVFKPNTAINYLTDSFGLSSFNSPQVKRVENEIEPVVIHEVLENVNSVPNTTDDVISIKPQTTNYTWLKASAAILVLSMGGLYGYKLYYDQQVESEITLVEKSVQDKLNKKIQEATFALEIPKETIQVKVPSKIKPYHLIAGAYEDEENANKALEQLKKEGFEKAHILPKNKFNLYPICFESFEKLEDAQHFKDKISAETGKDVWLKID